MVLGMFAMFLDSKVGGRATGIYIPCPVRASVSFHLWMEQHKLS